MAGIYIHIPFCKKKCKYCAFYSIDKVELIDQYIENLLLEISLFSQKYKKKTEIDTIFIGGGTPSLLSPEQIQKITDVLYESFSINKEIEYTIESNPSSINKDYLLALKEIGINRISIGIQSLNDDELKFLGRLHNSEQALQAMQAIKDAGFTNYNCDLIFSVPGQTEASITKTLETMVKMEVPHLSLYSLIYEEGTPLTQELEKKEFKPIDEKHDFGIYSAVAKFLNRKKYNHYEVSNYARHGYECKHNLTYWNGIDYYGFGVAAHSFLQGIRSWNYSDIYKYFESLANKQLPIENMEKLTEDNKLAEHLFLGLRAEGVELKQFNDSKNVKLLQEFTNRLINEGKAVISNSKFKLTDDGFFLCDEIAVRMYNYLTLDYSNL